MKSPADPRLTGLAVRYLSRSSHSQAEVVQYLNRKLTPGSDPHTIAAVIDYLSTLQLIDDAVFAQEYSHLLLQHGKGPTYIRYKLRQKGVESQIIDQAITSIDQEEVEKSAISLALKYLRQHPSLMFDKYTQAKLNHYLYSHGYSSVICRKVIDEIHDKSVQ